MRRHVLRVTAVALLVACALALHAQKRAITEKDLFQFVWIGDPQVSPDGARVAFVRVTVNEKKDGYDTAIWSVATAGGPLQPLTSGKRDGTPRWSPDGKYLAFARTAEESGGRPGRPQLYYLALSGGEAQPLTTLPRGASNPVWSPDGSHIAFGSDTNPDDVRKERQRERAPKTESKTESRTEPRSAPGEAANEQAAREEGAGETTNFNPEHESDVRVITRAVYRMNGAGYLDPTRPNHIWVLAFNPQATEPAKPVQLTSGKYAEADAVWSKDGKQIYFTSSRIDEPYYEEPRTAIFAVAASGGEPQKIAIGSGVGGDNGPPRAAGQSVPVWSADGRNIVDVVAKEGRANLYSFDAATGATGEFTRGDHAIESFRLTREGRVVAAISTPTMLGDLFVFDAQREPNAAPRRLTNINEKLFSQLNLTAPEEIWYTSFDGKKVQTWVQKPPDFSASKKYPLILNIHGGPHSAYGYVFDHEFQWMAAKGYVVLYPNPRGSTSYGEQFGNIIQYHYPGDDFRDLMLGVDEVLKRGYVDAKKLGVTGGSGGGLLTNWVVGHTDRFAAAVAQRDIADWTSWWYTADFTLFQPTWFQGPPFEQEADFKARSPITYIKNVKTPMLFVLGEADYRTPPTSGGEQMFRALKYRHIPTVMVRFPGESHELSRSGQPWHRVERLQHIVSWMDKWLMGRDVPAYRDAKATAMPASATPPEQRPPKD